MPIKTELYRKTTKRVLLPAFESNSNLCPANVLKVYMERTESIRKTENSLFLTTTPKHHTATAATIVRWIKTGLSKTGIDTSIFKGQLQWKFYFYL